MSVYFKATLLFTFILGFSIIGFQNGFSENKQDNHFSYYEKNCNNDSCTVISCSEDDPCNTPGLENKSITNLKSANPVVENLDSDNDYDIIDLINEFLN